MELNSDLTRIPALLATKTGLETVYVPVEAETTSVESPAPRKRKSRARPKTDAQLERSPFIDPQPGDQVSANGRTRHVLRVERKHVYYNLGEPDSRDHAVSLAGWRAWCKEWGTKQ
jgi:hypothetical protein